MAIIAPSILSADFLNLGSACDMINRSTASWIHLDIMDGNFVPNISFGFEVVRQLRPATNRFFDLHLMINHPEQYVDVLRDAGANSITIHLEGCPHAHHTIRMIKQAGMKAAVALNPHTHVSQIEAFLDDLDMVLLMSVNPGFGGQQFLSQTLCKINRLKNMIQYRGQRILIEVDGGITIENAPAVVEAGADVLVAGSAIFNSSNPIRTIQQMSDL